MNRVLRLLLLGLLTWAIAIPVLGYLLDQISRLPLFQIALFIFALYVVLPNGARKHFKRPAQVKPTLKVERH